jgi:hypothetical protein
MTTLSKITALVFTLFPFLSACSSLPSYIQKDVVPADSLHVVQVVAIAKREDILKLEAYKSIISSGVADADVIDGSMAVARVYCCGGISKELSSEYINRIFLYVKKDLKVGPGDFVEIRVGRPPEKGVQENLNAVTRIVYKYGDKPESCWWDPKNDKLWLRVPYCEWMSKEGWIKQDGLYPAWFKPAS